MKWVLGLGSIWHFVFAWIMLTEKKDIWAIGSCMLSAVFAVGLAICQKIDELEKEIRKD